MQVTNNLCIRPGFQMSSFDEDHHGQVEAAEEADKEMTVDNAASLNLSSLQADGDPSLPPSQAAAASAFENSRRARADSAAATPPGPDRARSILQPDPLSRYGSKVGKLVGPFLHTS